MDTVWPGPREFGCPAEDPFSIMEEFYRVIKPGGFVYLLLVYLFGTYFTYRIYRVTICKATQQQSVIIMQKIQLLLFIITLVTHTSFSQVRHAIPIEAKNNRTLSYRI